MIDFNKSYHKNYVKDVKYKNKNLIKDLKVLKKVNLFIIFNKKCKLCLFILYTYFHIIDLTIEKQS